MSEAGVRAAGRGRTALVTGASGGIGYELARLCAADGYDLVLVARDAAALARAAGGLTAGRGIAARVVAADLARPEAPGELAEALAGREVDILVNNAGVGAYGPFAASDLATQLALLRLNVVALTELTRRFLPGMLARRSGKILNVASTAAFLPGPLMATYYASKAFVLSFSEALAEETRGTGVTVTALCPGPTHTNFHRQAAMSDSRMLRYRLAMDAGAVARAGYRGMRRGRRVVVPGRANWLMAQAVRVAPRALLARAVHAAQVPLHE
ncbi:MAG TPA: SDR family oxidoreductase [Thermomicrobiales bacterium]|nr:SDR family oxidoreductase [Thermomicrobiales bacterium]